MKIYILSSRDLTAIVLFTYAIGLAMGWWLL